MPATLAAVTRPDRAWLLILRTVWASFAGIEVLPAQMPAVNGPVTTLDRATILIILGIGHRARAG